MRKISNKFHKEALGIIFMGGGGGGERIFAAMVLGNSMISGDNQNCYT